jgi:hypothetical protein
MHTHQVWRQLQLVSHGSKLLENQKLFTFLQQIGDGLGNLREIRDEPLIVASQSKKTVNLVHRHGRLPVKYILHLGRVNGYSFCRDHVMKEWNFSQPKFTFAEFCIELMILQSLKHNEKMALMLFSILEIDQNVVNENHDKLVQFHHEYGVRQIHEVSRGIRQSKRHN